MISNVNFLSWSVKFVNLNFSQYQSYKNRIFFFCLENHWNKLQYIWSLILSYLIDFPLWPDKSVNTNFWQYQSDRDSGKFICCLEIQSKIAEIISVCILNPLRLSLTGFYLGLKLQFKFKLQWEKVCFKLNICKRDLKPKKVKPIYQIFFDIVV